MTTTEIIEWLSSMPADSRIAIDDGGLSLVALDSHNNPTDEYLEVGGIPQYDEPDGEES